ncbi:MAG: FHA domain-containing protein [Anaerolineales bacterium]|nr:FHA domain-containing protein [Anaerolineales bacterium]
MSGSNNCPHCGAPNAAQARFCAKCGRQLLPPARASEGGMATCPRCNVPLRMTSRFCPSCGYNIAQMPVGMPAAPAPQAPAGPQSPGTQLLREAGGANEVIIRWMGGKTEQHSLTKSVVAVGRAPDNDIVINHPAVSGHHLRLEIHPSEMAVTDLNSTNGTQLNGQRIQPGAPQPLQAGAALRIGDLTGNWVSLAVGGEGAMELRTLSLGKLDLSDMTNLTIGRDPSSYLPLNHPAVSYRHAVISKQNGRILIRDLGSTNGTFVNGKRISQVPLASGDEVQIGPFKLVYDAQQQSLAQSMRMGHRLDAMLLGREVSKNRMILQDISLCVNPGEFIALVGGSGAGKSTLMKAMNGYEPANHGHMLLDGELLYPKLDLYRTQMGYVPQDDIIHRVLPVRLALWYAAKLRLPDARPAEIKARIQEVLRAVDLLEHADKPVRVLSGGQRKRVSIAVELLARPTLFFLDEPTSGLDPGLEKKMMYDLARLADEGRTIVLVTHATANIEQCDHVAFLSYGKLAYYGPPNDALKFYGVHDFSDIYLKLSQEIDPARGKPVPQELQPFYHPSTPGKTTAGALWAEHYRQSPYYQKFVQERQTGLGSMGRSGGAALPPASAPPRPARDSFLRQMFILASRQFDLVRHDWRTLSILLVVLPLIAMLFMGVSGEHDLVGRPGTVATIEAELKAELAEDGLEEGEKADYLPTANAETLVTMIGLALTQAGTFAAAYEIVKERAIFKRERAVNLNVLAYVLSKVLVLGGFAVIQVVSMVLILAVKLDFGFEGAIFEIGVFEMLITLYLAMLASIAFGLFISSIVPSTDVVLYAILVQLFIQIVLGGTMFPLESNPASYATVGYWTMDSLGSSIDLPKLNSESRICTVIEIPSMTGGDPTLETQCDSAERDLYLDYEHDEEHIALTWISLAAHIFVWILLTVIIQARKKTE